MHSSYCCRDSFCRRNSVLLLLVLQTIFLPVTLFAEEVLVGGVIPLSAVPRPDAALLLSKKGEVVLIKADSARSSIIQAGANARKLGRGDLNGDGYDDLVLIKDRPGEAKVILNRGGSFEGSSYPICKGECAPASPEIADFDGDGQSDIVVLTRPGKTEAVIQVLINDGHGRFVGPASISAPEAVSCTSSDTNGDFILEISCITRPGALKIFQYQPEEGAFEEVFSQAGSASTEGASFIRGIEGGFAVLGEKRLTLLKPAAGGTFGSEGGAIGVGPKAALVAQADLNSDGKEDLIIGYGSSAGVGVLLGDGQGGFAAEKRAALKGGRVDDLLLGDFDRDGDVDAVCLDSPAAKVNAFINDSQGSFTLKNSYPAGGVSSSMSLISASERAKAGIIDNETGRIIPVVIDSAGRFTARLNEGGKYVLSINSAERVLFQVPFYAPKAADKSRLKLDQRLRHLRLQERFGSNSALRLATSSVKGNSSSNIPLTAPAGAVISSSLLEGPVTATAEYRLPSYRSSDSWKCYGLNGEVSGEVSWGFNVTVEGNFRREGGWTDCYWRGGGLLDYQESLTTTGFCVTPPYDMKQKITVDCKDQCEANCFASCIIETNFGSSSGYEWSTRSCASPLTDPFKDGIGNPGFEPIPGMPQNYDVTYEYPRADGSIGTEHLVWTTALTGGAHCGWERDYRLTMVEAQCRSPGDPDLWRAFYCNGDAHSQVWNGAGQVYVDIDSGQQYCPADSEGGLVTQLLAGQVNHITGRFGIGLAPGNDQPVGCTLRVSISGPGIVGPSVITQKLTTVARQPSFSYDFQVSPSLQEINQHVSYQLRATAENCCAVETQSTKTVHAGVVYKTGNMENQNSLSCTLNALQLAASGIPTDCTCIDRLDNDCDGGIDCDDADCKDTELCRCLHPPLDPITGKRLIPAECCKLMVRYNNIYPPDGSAGLDPSACSPLDPSCPSIDGFCASPVEKNAMGIMRTFECPMQDLYTPCTLSIEYGTAVGDSCDGGGSCCNPYPPNYAPLATFYDSPECKIWSSSASSGSNGSGSSAPSSQAGSSSQGSASSQSSSSFSGGWSSGSSTSGSNSSSFGSSGSSVSSRSSSTMSLSSASSSFGPSSNSSSSPSSSAASVSSSSSFSSSSSPAPAPTFTPSPSPSPTATASPTASLTPSATPTPSGTATATPTATVTASPSPTVTATATATATMTATATFTATQSATPSPSATPSLTPSATSTPSRTATATPTSTVTASPSPTVTATATATLTGTATASATPTATSTPSASATATTTATVTSTATQSAIPSPSPATPTAASTPTLPPGCERIDVKKDRDDLHLGPEALKGYGKLMIDRLARASGNTGNMALAKRLWGSWVRGGKRYQKLLERCYAAIDQLPERYVVCANSNVCTTLDHSGKKAAYVKAIRELKQSEIRILNRATRLVFPSVKDAQRITGPTGKSIKKEAKRLTAVAANIPDVESRCW